jgi:hypothetical protein
MTASFPDEAIPSSADIGAAVSRSGAAAATQSAAEAQSATPDAGPRSPAPPRTALPGWPWLRAAFLLAAAAQLITISALLSADPLAASWSALLLAIAPALLTAVPAFAPPVAAWPATLVAAVALVIGIIGGLLHTGLFFVPALALLGVGGVKLWRGHR